ncbi:MAG: hypothetical protein RJA47_910 [Actinomycetota bacterium]
MMNGLPCRAGLLHIIGLETVSNGLLHEMQFAVHAVTLIVGMCPNVGARHRSKVLIAMSLTHRRSLPGPLPGSHVVPLTAPYTRGDPRRDARLSLRLQGQRATTMVRMISLLAPFVRIA